MKIIFSVYFILLGWLLFFVSCNAPRNNPLDPKNSESPYVILEGQVKDFRIIPLSNVSVYWRGGGALVKTNSGGFFKIDKIVPLDNWLVFQKEGYLTDSVLVEWNSQKKVSVYKLLNTIPVLDTVSAFSETINHHGRDPEYRAFIRAGVIDKDNDIDSVFWSIPELGIEDFLSYNVNTKFYEKDFMFSDYNLNNEAILGHDINILVQDVSGNHFLVGSTGINRVIKKLIEFYSPANQAVVSPSPTLKWKRYEPGFHHTYTLEIYFKQDEFTPPELKWRKENVPQTNTNYTIESQLTSGNYFWVIWAIDEFGDRARSKPASFEVQE